jgi:hypothetical protein
METTTPMAAGLDAGSTEQIRTNLRETKGWMKFLGIVAIIAGALEALTIVGIVIAWLPIWIGVLMTQAASRADEFVTKASPADLIEYHSKLKTIFTILGIVAIIGLIAAAIAIIIALIVLIAGGFALLNYW